MRVMAITATHGAFQYLVVEGSRKRRLDLTVTTNAKLRIVRLQHSYGREAWLFGIRGSWVDVRTGDVSASGVRMR